MEIAAIVEAALSFLKRYWYTIPIAGLVLALGVTRSDLSDAKAERDTLRNWQAVITDTTSRAAGIKGALALDQVGPQISSLGDGVAKLQGALDLKNRESEQRATAYATAVLTDKQNQAEAARQFATVSQSIERLRALAAKPGDPNCRASTDLLKELDGL